jgi:hypothetical protein
VTGDGGASRKGRRRRKSDANDSMSLADEISGEAHLLRKEKKEKPSKIKRFSEGLVP